MADWISPGTHIAAVGADKKGDQELESRLLMDARIFVDDIRQCRTDGEINVPLSEGLITEADIAGEIGEVVTGKKQGRTSDDEITIFDSTGIALQDSATVPLEYERAMAAGVGIEKKMIPPSRGNRDSGCAGCPTPRRLHRVIGRRRGARSFERQTALQSRYNQ
jgi:alanine dehydrogenase